MTPNNPKSFSETPDSSASETSNPLTNPEQTASGFSDAENMQVLPTNKTTGNSASSARTIPPSSAASPPSGTAFAEKGASKTLAPRLFTSLTYAGPILLLLVLALQTSFGLDVRSLWFSDEVRHASAYEYMMQTGKGLVLYLNGIPYPDKPPVYFWFLALLDQIPHVDGDMLFLLGAVVSAGLLLLATYMLALVTGCERKIALASGLILLSSFYFLGLTHYARMDLFFAFCITISHICFFKGWNKDFAPGWLCSAFAMAGIATLVKGPLGLVFPLLTSILYICVQARFRRFNARDAAAGFGLMLLILLGWLGAVVVFTGENDYLRNIFEQQIVARAANAWHHGEPWWYYLLALPLVWLPWTLLLPFLPWKNFTTKVFPRLKAARTQEKGLIWLWLGVLSGFLLLSTLSIKIAIYLTPLFPLLAILTARGLFRMSAGGLRAIQYVLSFLLLLLTGAFGALNLLPVLPPSLLDQIPPSVLIYLQNIQGTPFLAVICLIFALLFVKPQRLRTAEGTLLLTVLFITCLSVPLSMFTAPSLDPVMSPRQQAEALGTYVREGYIPISYKVYPGTYNYYAGSNMLEADTWEQLDALLVQHPKAIIAMRLNRFAQWPNRPATASIVNTQWIVDREFALIRYEKAAPLPTPEPIPQESAPEEQNKQPDMLPESVPVIPEDNPEQTSITL